MSKTENLLLHESATILHMRNDILDTKSFHALSLTNHRTEEEVKEGTAKEDISSYASLKDSPFSNQRYVNVTSKAHGAQIFFATDEWFAIADNLLKDEEPVFDPEAFCEQGKVMDGWESRRRREAGYDFCIIKLSERAHIMGIEVDTAHFTGNHVPAISVDLVDLSHEEETQLVLKLPGAVERLIHGGIQGTGFSPALVQQAKAACSGGSWKEILPATKLSPGYEETRLHYFALDSQSKKVGTHIRLNYFPDGGVARLRVWAIPSERDQRKVGPLYSPIKTGRSCTVVSHQTHENEEQSAMPSRQPYPYPELSAAINSGLGVMCSNKHYGEPWNLIQSSLGRDMGDGWETARHPDRPAVLVQNAETGLVDNNLSDWCILKLGSVASSGVSRVLLDTRWFRGNYPESVQVEGCCLTANHTDTEEVKSNASDMDKSRFETAEWFPLVPRGRMAPDSEHVYDAEKGQVLNASRPVSHVRVTIYPDGGLSRVRVYGATNVGGTMEDSEFGFPF